MSKERLWKFFKEEVIMTWIRSITVVMKINWQVKEIFKGLRNDWKLHQNELRKRRCQGLPLGFWPGVRCTLLG